MLGKFLGFFSQRKRKFFIKRPRKIILLDFYGSNNQKNIEKLIYEYKIDIFDYFKNKDESFYKEEEFREEVDLVIVCNTEFFIKIDEPLLLEKAEIFHSKKKFSEAVLLNSLKAYERSEQRNGL